MSFKDVWAKIKRDRGSDSAGFVSDDTIPAIKIVEDLGPVGMGDTVKDVVSGFQGVVTSWQKHLHGCDRLVVTPDSVGNDGKPMEGYIFDIMLLTVVAKATVPTILPKYEVEVGWRVRDVVTGFEGIVVVMETSFHGDIMVFIDPAKIGDDGKPAKVYGAFMGRIEVLERLPIPVAPEAPVKAKPGCFREERPLQRR